MAEVAEVEPLWPFHRSIAGFRLRDVEGVVAAALDEECRRRQACERRESRPLCGKSLDGGVFWLRIASCANP